MRACARCGATYEGRKGKTYCSRRCNEAARTARRIEDCRRILRRVKSAPCLDCGRSYPPHVMDLDHVRGVKVADVSALVAKGKRSAVLIELEKCEVVCANCHRERTWARANS